MRHASLWHRLVSQIEIIGECWVWTGTVRRHGGGYRPAMSMRVPGITHPRQFNAARVMCELIHGPAPLGHEASHLCVDEWCCVCPDHLMWETHIENCARRGVRDTFEPAFDEPGTVYAEPQF